MYRATSPGGPFSQVNEEEIPPSSPGLFEDTTVWPETTFWYELRALLPEGDEDVVGPDLASVTTGGRLTAALHSAYPKPFVGETSVFFAVPSHVGPVSLGVYNVRGQLVKKLVEGPVDRGRHAASSDGRDGDGIGVSSGVYFVRARGESAEVTQKLVRIR